VAVIQLVSYIYQRVAPKTVDKGGVLKVGFEAMAIYSTTIATDAIAARVGAMDVNGKTERSGVFRERNRPQRRPRDDVRDSSKWRLS
jgi:hypothetical protein